MEQRIYEVRITGLDKTDQTIAKKEEQKADEKKEKKSNQELSQSELLGKNIKKTVGVMATAYALSQVVVQPIMRDKVNMAEVTGDIVQARNLQRKQAITNQAVGLAFEAIGIVASFLVNPFLGGVALLGNATKHISSSIARSQTNKMISAKNEIDNVINSYERNRMIRV